MRSELVGFLFPDDSLLRADEPFRLVPGLNVVYGLNGAGKSRLLRGVTNALRGIQSDVNVAIIVRVPTSEPPQSSGQRTEDVELVDAFGRGPAQAIAAARASAYDFDWELPEYAAPVDQRTIHPSTAYRLLDELKWERLGTATPLAQEIAADSLFLFSATGTSSAPSWDVWPVADTRLPLASAVSAELDRLAEIVLTWEGDTVEPMVALEGATVESPLFAVLFNGVWSHGAARRSFDPTPFVAYSIDQHQADEVEPVRVSGRVDFGVDLIDADLNPNSVTREHLAVLHEFLRVALWERSGSPVRATLRARGLMLLSPAFRAKAQSPTERWADWGDVVFGLGLDDDDMDDTDRERFVQAKRSEVESILAEFVAELEASVNSELASVLLDAPKATLRLSRSVQPFATEPAFWTFGRNLPLEALSTAEARWATRIICEAITRQARELALGSDHDRSLLYVIDEPEAALHRAAEAHMAAAIRRRASSGAAMLVATHSPELLDAPEGHLTEVKKNAAGHGRSLVQSLDLSDRGALDDLGLVPSDLLRWPRVILLVEGEHDAALLDAFLGHRLRTARVKVVPLHGGAKLPQTVDSQVLFDHTDAHVVAMLDNLRAERLTDVWRRATELAIRGDVGGAKTAVLEGLPDDQRKKGDEANYMRTWLIRALDAGLASRATPFALSEVDVIRYLPVSCFVPKATSWAALDAQHQEERADTSRKTPVPADFKRWLEQRFKVSITPKVLRDAAAAADPPRDFELLMKTLEALSNDVR